MELKLYSYWRSSASYRVRIALNLKELSYDLIPIHLVRDGGEQHKRDFIEMNPQRLVPILTDGGRVFRQSMAIMEYLEEAYPDPVLLPAEIRARGRVRSLAQIINCDVHPLNNLRVLMYLEKELEVRGSRKTGWIQYWISEGFTAFEELLNISPTTGTFCEGDYPTLADCCLIPQVYNAIRFKCDLEPYPEIRRIYENCMELEPFFDASPEEQPDYEE
ncbi:MAG: maleylacetoacetate isomerase [Xanthomonadales bacterium]|nr:maleylacetoacetate isomerase [Xanthomonadales bacterium]